MCGSKHAIFQYLADFANTAEWDPNVRDARRLTPAHVQAAVGDKFELTTLFRGRASITTYTLNRVDTDVGLVLDGESDTVKLVDTIALHPDGMADGGSRTCVDYRLKVRLKGRLAPFSFILRPALEELATESIGGLVATCAKRFGGSVDEALGASRLPLGGPAMRSRNTPARAAFT